MISHHELVAGQAIERVFELLRLRDREVSGVHHAIELPLEQRLLRPEGLPVDDKRLLAAVPARRQQEGEGHHEEHFRG